MYYMGYPLTITDDSTQSLVQINLYQSQIHPDTAMVAGTWLVLEDLSLVQFELYRGGVQNLHPP